MSKKKQLIVTAHPDDETLFMGGLVMMNRKLPWHIICVTDGNADGQRKRRFRDFSKACKMLGAAKFEMWDFPDVYEQRLDSELLVERLKELDLPASVYTHGITGEYGHPHHQDVSWATHKAFHRRASVYSVAYNCLPDLQVSLSRKAFSMKTKIIGEVYGSETRRFAHLIPATAVEGFAKVPMKEVDAIYGYLVDKKNPKTSDIKKYAWYWGHFKKRFSGIPKRIF